MVIPMLKKYLLSHPTLDYADDLAKLCQPLFKLGISLFYYARTYNDCSRVVLTSKADMHELFVKQITNPLTGIQYLKESLATSVANQGTRVFSARIEPGNIFVSDSIKYFGIDHTLVITKKYLEYKEDFHFSSYYDTPEIMGFYLNYLDLFERFILYFKDQAAGLLSHAISKKILLPKPFQAIERVMQKKAKQKYEAIHDTMEYELPVQKYYVNSCGQEVYLTRREVECLRWVVKGKSAEEIAIILGITRRTVETHIANMKEKLGCYKTLQLGYQALKEKIVE